MSLCHIYNKTTHSTHKKALLNAFEGSVSVDIENINSTEEFAIYVIEIESISKTISLKIKALFEFKQYPLIYFIVPKVHPLMLFQLAFLLNTKSIITINQDTNKVISKLKTDLLHHQYEYQEINLGKTLINTHLFMHFKNDKLQFASKPLLEEFSSEKISDIEDRVCSKIDMRELLSSQNSISELISEDLKDDETFYIKSVSNRDENLVSLERRSAGETLCNQNETIVSRINFVEFLKDRLLDKMISDKLYSLITININDLKNRAQGMNEVDKELFRKEFIAEVELILGDKIMLAQYDADMYIAFFEDINFTKLKQKAQNFHIQMTRFINKQKTSPTLSLYTLNIKATELNTYLNILDNISNKKLTITQKNDKNLEYINNIQDSMNEDEIINFLLDSAFVNNTSFKLLNVYRGIFINTKSVILKKENDAIYVKVEQIQAAVMSMENKTIIQSSAFIRDIQATLRYVNIREKIAVLENFKILDLNVNLRKHGRVNPARKIIVALSLVGSKIKGEVVDISASSISLKIKYARVLSNIVNRDIGLDFYLPSALSQSGQHQLEETATVIYDSDIGQGFLKLVCIFNENTNNEDFLIDYVYSRQRSIINEMREKIK